MLARNFRSLARSLSCPFKVYHILIYILIKIHKGIILLEVCGLVLPVMTGFVACGQATKNDVLQK